MDQVWYKKIGSDESLISAAITCARASGSIGATEVVVDSRGNQKEATVRREGYQEPGYVRI